MARPLSNVAREKILEAATEVIRQVGVQGFSIDQVARQSGVAKTTIYRHFDSRNNLVIAAFHEAHGVHMQAAPNNGSLRADLFEVLSTDLPAFDDRNLQAIFYGIVAATAHDEELRDLVADGRLEEGNPLVAILERAVERGEIPPGMDPMTAFGFIEGPFVIRSLFQPESLASLDLELLVDQIARALGAS
jgi:AcrR family transcriptional regulator